jgi:hypothetical protein
MAAAARENGAGFYGDSGGSSSASVADNGDPDPVKPVWPTRLDSVPAMRYRIVITETNIDESAHPEAFRYLVDAEAEADAVAAGRARFTEQTRREPAPRATIDIELLE